MSRPALGPRLYLDRKRGTWVIRDGKTFLRLGLSEDKLEAAETALNEYLQGGLSSVGDGEQVYFLRAHDKLKIGRAVNVASRVAALQRMSPIKLRLLWAQPGGSAAEATFHRRFQEYRVHGEWFEIKGELENYLGQYVKL